MIMIMTTQLMVIECARHPLECFAPIFFIPRDNSRGRCCNNSFVGRRDGGTETQSQG